jgi:hypothetical protein
MRGRAIAMAAAGWVALSAGVGLAHGQAPSRRVLPPVLPAVPNPHGAAQLSPEDTDRFTERFSREVWPLMERAEGGCVGCHGAQNPSQLHFAADGATANFKTLLSHGFFEPETAGSILARVASPLKEQRMPPPPAKPWTDEEIATLRAFVTDLYDRVHASGVKVDELFPVELLDPYTGKRVSGGLDNTFLTYRQLRGKIKTIFGDEWKRDERDLFEENVAQFGGADFIKRFDESSKASATFLSALDTMSRDVASRAYLGSTGPFAGRAQSLPSPAALKAPDPAYRAEITRLYRKLLYRSPAPQEMAQAFTFVKDIYQAQAASAATDSTLDFELSVEDSAGRVVSKAVRVQVSGEPLGLFQEYLDETVDGPQPQVTKKLDGTFTFKPGLNGQRFEMSNEATSGNVSLVALELKGPLPEETVQRIGVADPAVRLEGAWQRRTQDGFVSFEDGNDNKGSSRIEIPIHVAREGKYEVAVVWRKPAAGVGRPGRGPRPPASNAAAVLAQVHSPGSSRIVNPPLPPLPPPGEARFIIDQTVDTIPYWDLKTAFKFGSDPAQGVVIDNAGTKRRVVADSVKFAPAVPGGKEFVLDDPLAEGDWPKYVLPTFRPYNLVGGGAVTDNNERKGEMHLLYRPSKSTDWSADGLYRVLVGFPGKADNETQVPVVVRALESTPIVQASAPLHANVGATVTLDASATYNLQRTPLHFTWTQVGGPRVTMPYRHSDRAAFTVEPMSAQQAAWEGLCRALMRHPDFLFTRPRSLAFVTDKADRRRLQLVKIAQDLVGRPPTDAEVRSVDAGAPLSRLVNQYLNSQEFRDFYFYRIRLALETRGSEVDDEPVRLWSYVAFNDRPFKEILTADFTVDAAMRKQPRPAYYGHTGLLTMQGFVKGKPGLPHFNYAAQVTEKFLGYVFEVPPSVIAMRDSITAASTTSPTSVCYSCHRVLTPLAYQRLAWDDDGVFKPQDGDKPVDDTDRGLVPSYPFRGKGMEAFATQAANKERFVRTMFQTHFVMFFGREMRYQEDERGLYRRMWDDARAHNYSIRSLLRLMVTSPEYLNGSAATVKTAPVTRKRSVARG